MDKYKKGALKKNKILTKLLEYLKFLLTCLKAIEMTYTVWNREGATIFFLKLAAECLDGGDAEKANTGRGNLVYV